MKFRMDPTEKLLALPPEVLTCLETDGFIGALYQPEQDLFPDRALLVVSGADGSFSLARLIAEQFVRQGITALALAYWNMEGLPGQCSHIPLESAERAALWLQARGFDHIGMWGISLGAVYALACGIQLPDLIRCTAAVSPMSCCPQGFRSRGPGCREWSLCEGSALSFRGRDLPFSPLHSFSPEPAQLPVEQLSGPLLLLAADQDEVWPAKAAAEALLQRAKQHHAPDPVVYEHFLLASHYLLPCQIHARRIFRIEREHPEECARSNREAFQHTLQFLRTQWV